MTRARPRRAGILAGPHNTLQRRHPYTGELVWTAQLTAPASEVYGPDGGEIAIWALKSAGSWLPGALRRLVGGRPREQVVVASLGSSLFALPAAAGTHSAAIAAVAAPRRDGGGGDDVALVPARTQARPRACPMCCRRASSALPRCVSVLRGVRGCSACAGYRASRRPA